MAFLTLLLAGVLLGAYALYKYWDSSRHQKTPKGLKPLPGPKGKATYPIGINHFPLWTLSNNC
jgi:hypothetical protein